MLILISLWAFLPNVLSAAPKAELMPFWNESNEANARKIDHSAWQAILDGYLIANHVSGVNRFDYKKLKANAADKENLDSYLLSKQKLDPRTYSKAEQKAYWINLYNALTIQIVFRAYPVKSITQIHKGWFAFGPWDDVHAKVAGQKLTLNNIEHGILRPIWQDNRIHYAVNCASYACPNLSPKAYTAANMEALLEENARDYVNHPRAVKLMNEDHLVVSSIYHWYKVDFGDTDESLIKHLQKYAKPDLANSLQGFNGSIAHEYNWELNQL